MTNRERENRTLDFVAANGRGSVEETFYPWDLTVREFAAQGLPEEAYRGITYLTEDAPKETAVTDFLVTDWSEGVKGYEEQFGFDPLLRVGLVFPARYGLEHANPRAYIAGDADWDDAMRYTDRIKREFFSDQQLWDRYGPFRERHQKGEYPVRMYTEGYFFAPRELLGIEEHLYAFYDMPELLHRIERDLLEFHLEYLTKINEILPADVLYFSEDLSGKNGPMISREMFEEFVGSYYRKLFPSLRKTGIKYIFMDTDGDFDQLIPDILETGIDGFLPMDVNAGMDINKVRGKHPRARFIGGFNKLVIAEGREAIDREFARIMPVIRQGGYIPGCDHQLAPDAGLENYRYFVRKLKEVMEQAGTDGKTGM